MLPPRRIRCRHDLAVLSTPPGSDDKIEIDLDDAGGFELPAHRRWTNLDWPERQDQALEALDDLAAAGCERVHLDGPALVASLPGLERLPLTHLSVEGDAAQARQAVARVIGLPHLVGLKLEVEGEVADALPALARAPGLERLSVTSQDGSQSLLEAAAQLTRLRVLELDSRRDEERTEMGPRAANGRRELIPPAEPRASADSLLDVVARLRDLEELELSLRVEDLDAPAAQRLVELAGRLRRLSGPFRGDDVAVALARLPLESLSIARLSDRGVAALAALRLRELSLTIGSATPAGLSKLPASLQCLSVWNPLVDLAWLSQLSSLRSLRVCVDRRADARVLAEIGELRELERLEVEVRCADSEPEARGPDLGPLAQLHKLWRLWLHGPVRFDVVTTGALATLHSLEQLHLSNTRITDDALVGIARLGLPNLRRVSIDGGEVTDVGVRSIGACTSVTYFGVSDCPGMTIEALRDLAGTGCYVVSEDQRVMARP